VGDQFHTPEDLSPGKISLYPMDRKFGGRRRGIYYFIFFKRREENIHILMKHPLSNLSIGFKFSESRMCM
jgi:hypothetical protein